MVMRCTFSLSAQKNGTVAILSFKMHSDMVNINFQSMQNAGTPFIVMEK